MRAVRRGFGRLLPLARLLERFRVYAEFGYFVLDDAFGGAEHFGGLGLVAAGCLEHVDDEGPFLGLDEG